MISTLEEKSEHLDAKHTPVWHIGILTVLMIVQITCGALSSTASTDTNRDIYFAQQIATAREFPLLGPQINGMLHLGPVWFYVLAIAAWLVPNASAVTAFMAAIGSLQFPLAYQLGRRFGSAREGLLFALTLALPGFMAVSLVSLTHTIAVIPCLLAAVFAALAYRTRPDWKRAFWVGAITALAVNAHPTTLFLLVVLLFWCAAKTRGLRRWIIHGLIVAAFVVLSFAPMLYAQWQNGFADAVTTANYAQGTWSFPSLRKALFLIFAILWYGPKYMARFWLDIPQMPARWLLSIYGVLLVAAFVGLGWRYAETRSKRKLIAVLAILLVLQSIFVCGIRTDMPPWMIYAEWPLIAALLALGLERVFQSNPSCRLVLIFGLAVTTSWSLAIWLHMAEGKIEFVEMNPTKGKLPLMADIREYSRNYMDFRMPRLPFREVFAIGQPLCKPTTLFGHYAYLVDISYGIGAIQECGSRENIQLGGTPTARSKLLVGLRKEVWESLQMHPDRWVGVLGISTPVAVWRSTLPLYPETPHLSTWPHHIVAATRRFIIEGSSSPEEAVLVSHRANRYLSFSVISAEVDGIEIKPLYEDLMTAVYRLPAGFVANKVHWRIEVEGAQEYVDVLTFTSDN